MSTIKQLETRIETIEKRNAAVECDKSWEISTFRRILLMIFTYVSMSLYMYAINLPHPWLNAVIPTIGFLLSTLTMPFFKAYWKKYFNHK